MTKYLSDHFVNAWRKVGSFTVVKRGDKVVKKIGGNVAVYFCTPEFRVIHSVLGNVSAETFLHEAKWAVELSRTLKEDDLEGNRRVASRAHQQAVSKRWEKGMFL